MKQQMAALLVGLLASVAVHADLAPETAAKLAAALDADIRSAEERARDDNRLPRETLAFFGLRDDMRVLELFPGTGWYTKLLAPVLRDRGKLYLAISTNRVAPIVAETEGLDRVEVLDINADMPMTETRGIFELRELSFWVEDLDMVLTFRNAHNLTAEGRANLNRAVFEALKPGGIYGVLDHGRRHMEPLSPQNRRRTDPVQIVHEALEAGFEFVAHSDLHFNPDDDLSREVADPSIKDRSSRYTLMFRKPLVLDNS